MNYSSKYNLIYCHISCTCTVVTRVATVKLYNYFCIYYLNIILEKGSIQHQVKLIRD